jgi:hypothetical protein
MLRRCGNRLDHRDCGARIAYGAAGISKTGLMAPEGSLQPLG